MEVVREARRWIGTPFVHQGRSRHGVDCIGLIVCVRAAFDGFPEGMREIRNYRRRPADGLLLDRVRHYCSQLTEPEPAALVLVQWPKDATPSHTMLCAGDTVIHAYQRVGRVVEVGYRAHWERWTHSLWRLPGVEP
jgi:hypothetical protein